MRVLAVLAHPERRSFNAALADAAVETLQEAGHEVQLSDLCRMGFKAVADADDFSGEREDPDFRLDREHPDERLRPGVVARSGFQHTVSDRRTQAESAIAQAAVGHRHEMTTFNNEGWRLHR
jgi:Flavodoxin-like fold